MRIPRNLHHDPVSEAGVPDRIGVQHSRALHTYRSQVDAQAPLMDDTIYAVCEAADHRRSELAGGRDGVTRKELTGIAWVAGAHDGYARSVE
jgi:hypothetical protein